MSQPHPRTIGDYSLVRILHEGPLGTRYEARVPSRLTHASPTVALKISNNNASIDTFNRFSNETRLMSRSTSPHLVHLLDAGSYQDRLFYSTPLFEYGSLSDGASSLEQEMILQIVADASRGAHELHELGVAHRDIKPSNILISPERQGVLTELGLAQFLDHHSITQAGAPIGALHYVAPQILWGEQASRQTDIWSLGQCLHFALVGTTTRGEIDSTGNLFDTLTQLVQRRPEVDPRVPERLRRLIERSQGIGSALPYRDSAEFANDLETSIQERRDEP